MTIAKGFAKDQPAGFTNRIEKIAIVGAAGHVGRHILNGLQQFGNFTIRAISRVGSTSKQPSGGVELMQVDYDDSNALIDALRGQQVLIITMAVTAPRDTVAKLVRAGTKAGVAYVMPNWFGHDAANRELCRDSWLEPGLAICSEIEAEGETSYLLLGCNFWYEWSIAGGPDRFGFDFKNRSLIWFDEGDVVFNVTTWPQVGRAIASLLSLKELPQDANDDSPCLSQFRNSSFYTASFRLNQKDMFESVKRVTNTTDADWIFTREDPQKRWRDATEELEKHNFAAFPKMLYSRMFFPTADGDLETRHGLHNKLLGLPEEDLDEFTAIALSLAESDEFNEAAKATHSG